MGGWIGETIHDSTRCINSSTVKLLINVAYCVYPHCGVYKGTMSPRPDWLVICRYQYVIWWIRTRSPSSHFNRSR